MCLRVKKEKIRRRINLRIKEDRQKKNMPQNEERKIDRKRMNLMIKGVRKKGIERKNAQKKK